MENIITDVMSPGGRMSMVIVGQSGSGKTYLAINLLLGQFENVFSNIHLFAPTYDSLANTDNWKRRLALPPKYIHSSYSEEELELAQANAEQEFEDTHLEDRPFFRSVFIFDDCAGDKLFASPWARFSGANELTRTGRHSGVSTLILAQRYGTLTLDMRASATDIIIVGGGFPLTEIKSLFKEVPLGRSYKDLKMLVSRYGEHHGFVGYNTASNRSYTKKGEIVLRFPGETSDVTFKEESEPEDPPAKDAEEETKETPKDSPKEPSKEVETPLEVTDKDMDDIIGELTDGATSSDKPDLPKDVVPGQ